MVGKVLADMQAAGHPFKVFEAFRTPQRQAYLYAQGRTAPGSIVTKARPWESYHQYGLAADFVLYIGGNWSWDTAGHAKAWKDMNASGRAHGLMPLSWELPHLQIAGTSIDDLQAGRYPAGGDASWEDNVEEAIAGWSGSPPAPPVPDSIPVRPALDMNLVDLADTTLEATALTLPGSSGWHRQFGGKEWKFDGDGVYVRDYEAGAKPLRSAGQPITARAIWNTFSVQLDAAARRFGIPPELLIMTIAVEAAAYREQGFTGPATFRWESHVWNRDVSPNSQGDYSAGPMQTLGTTARWVIEAQSLPYHPFQVAPVYRTRPVPAPASHPLYEATANIEIGTAEIKQRIAKTGFDPVLVAAAFNSGGIYQTDTNAWRLKSYGDHIDRAVKWYGDACAVLKEAGVR